MVFLVFLSLVAIFAYYGRSRRGDSGDWPMQNEEQITGRPTGYRPTSPEQRGAWKRWEQWESIGLPATNGRPVRRAPGRGFPAEADMQWTWLDEYQLNRLLKDAAP